MNGAETEDGALPAPGPLPAEGVRARRRVMLAVALSLAALLLLLWLQRTPIAEHFVQRELAARQVHASYSIAQIGFRTQRIEHLVLGDPARPDLTARSIEVDIDYGAFMPRVGAIRARGVRLYGRVDGQGVHLGELDKFRDPSSTEPFSLPDIQLTLEDMRARLETPAGPVGLSLNGRGNLRDGFAGTGAALIRNARAAGCAAPQATAYMDIRVTSGAPRLSGPVRADALRCGTMGAAGLAFRSDVALDKAMAHISGRISGGARAARGAGVTAAEPRLDLRFDGDGKTMKGRAMLALAGLRHAAVQADAARMEGDWQWAAQGEGSRGAAGFGADARLSMRRVRAFDAKGLSGLATATADTPVGPLVQRLAGALTDLQRDNTLSARLQLAQRGGGGQATLPAFTLKGGQGQHLALSEGGRLLIDWPRGRWTLDGGLKGGGGGLPDFALRLDAGEKGGVSGQMFVQPYAAGRARLELDAIRFRARGDGGTRVSTRLRLDGPLPDGELRGLELPLVVNLSPAGDWSVNPGCTPVRFGAIRSAGLTLDPRALSVCAGEGGALVASRRGRLEGGGVVRKLDLAGSLGGSAMRLAAGEASLSLGRSGFMLRDALLSLGDSKAPVRLAATRFEGALAGGGLGGSMSGVEAKIATVPLLVREGDARWGYAAGALSLKGRILVLDDASPDRFNPVESRDFALRMADGRIQATGSLNLPGRDRRLADLTVTHQLSNGRGMASFSVSDLRFDQKLQPDEITHMALGVVANVDGVVNGSGEIGWRGDSVTSSGTFTTDGMNLAAAFGPVQGLSTRIHFTDLLGLVTDPSQEIRLASVHPGIEARDGVVHYQLLPGYRVAIEDGHWPFAGGDLNLLPTTMDMSSEQPRNLRFRVVGLDAGAFITLLELDNISATGTFDGLLPMVFDAQGGRIVGGVLNARQQGMPPLIIDHVEGLDIPCDRTRQAGHLAYVGQVSNEDLGMAGKLAFDALKDLQYKCLTILMDGAIDGEVVTQVLFNGINRGELSSVPKIIADKFVGLPFIFNVKIEAPFRGLMNTAQSFIDPSLLIRSQLGDGLELQKNNGVAVQPRESEDVHNKETK